jgi:hypothetical protein
VGKQTMRFTYEFAELAIKHPAFGAVVPPDATVKFRANYPDATCIDFDVSSAYLEDAPPLAEPRTLTDEEVTALLDGLVFD